MLDTLLLHEPTRATLAALTEQPPQGLLLTGPTGIGKLTIATAWGRQLVDHDTSLRVVSPDDKGTITIEVIRELYVATRTRQAGRQVVIVEGADHMSIEAENAFLKLLEEPRDGLSFILTAAQSEALLPTILSRVQQVGLLPLSDDVIRRAIVARKPGIAQHDLSQIVFLAQGCPGIAFTLLSEDQLPKQRQQMQLVKQLLTAKPYERFGLIGKLAADRETCILSLGAMMRIVEMQLRSASSTAQLRHWTQLAQALEEALRALSQNGNMRAQLLYLFSRY